MIIFMMVNDDENHDGQWVIEWVSQQWGYPKMEDL